MVDSSSCSCNGVSNNIKQDVTRRAVNKGALWAVPVITAVATVPAHAASEDSVVDIQFLDGPYKLNSCDELNDVQLLVTVSEGSLPAFANVTLPAGLEFSDGLGSPRDLPVDADTGFVNLPAIKSANGDDGIFKLSATASTASTSSEVRVASPKTIRFVNINGVLGSAYPDLPNGAEPLEFSNANSIVWALGNDGVLYRRSLTNYTVAWTPVISNVDVMAQSRTHGSGVVYLQDGTFQHITQAGAVDTYVYPALPNGRVMVDMQTVGTGSVGSTLGRVWIIDDQGNFYDRDIDDTGSWTAVSSVPSASIMAISDTELGGVVAQESGQIRGIWTQQFVYPALPTGVTAKKLDVAGGGSTGRVTLVLGSDDVMYHRLGTNTSAAWTVVATDVANMSQSYNHPSSVLVKKDGTIQHIADDGVLNWTYPSLPTGVEAVDIQVTGYASEGNIWIRGSDNNMYFRQSVNQTAAWTVVTSDVLLMAKSHTANNGIIMTADGCTT
ncbi:MAG: hypothetical protein QM571_05890 [Micrococcaceae bacterium]